MVVWDQIDTVLLDMDGTLLDLHFDNYFWTEYLPVKWGEKNNMEESEAKKHLTPKFERNSGTLSWYCVDFWSEELQIDIMALKNDIDHLIITRPHTEEFLEYLSRLEKHIVMVTNSHQKLLDLKMEKTRIDRYFHKIYCSHGLGVIKEEMNFWVMLEKEFNFDPHRTLLIDDNLAVLRAARRYGIRHLLSIARPDSRSARKDTAEFMGITSFKDLIL